MLQPLDPKILEFLNSHKKIFIAYSGGLDSHVLLHFLTELFKGKKLTAIHVNHNINSQAKNWENHCQKVCKSLGVDFVVRGVDGDGKRKGESLEEHLRKLRYEVFAKILPKNVCLVTAHHQDDQAETLLLRLFRGSGPKGLAAMLVMVEFAKGYLVRPFLEYSRKDLLAYAKKHKLRWIEDDSNLDPKFDRNFVRHKLLPVIQKKWPGVAVTLNRSSRHLAEANELLEELAQIDLEKVVGEVNNTLSRAALRKLPISRQKNVLRFWLKQQRLIMPSEVKLVEIIKNVINSRNDATPLVDWTCAEIRRYRDNIYAAEPLISHDNKQTLFFVKNSLKLPGDLGVLKIKTSKKVDLKKIKVTFRQGGEKIKIPGRSTRDLKKLMQEWDIPPWLRDRIPLIWYDGEIITVIGCYSEGWLKVELT